MASPPQSEDGQFKLTCTEDVEANEETLVKQIGGVPLKEDAKALFSNHEKGRTILKKFKRNKKGVHVRLGGAHGC